MSQYKISKVRLAQIIKEEYQSLQENNPLVQTINRWAEEGKDIPRHLTVGRMTDLDDDTAVETLAQIRDLLQGLEDRLPPGSSLDNIQHQIANLSRDLIGAANRVEERLTPDQVEIDEVEIEKEESSLQKESINSIRDLIRQEIKNL